MDRDTPSDRDSACGSGWRTAVRGNVLMMGLVSLFTDFSSEMIYPLLPVFLAGLVPAGAAAVYLGLMEGLAEATASLLKILSGRLSDAVRNRKGLVVIGYGVSSLVRPLMGLAGAGWHVVGLRFADRVGKGLRTSPRDALIGDSVDARHRGLAFSFHRAMDHVGAVLGPVISVAILYSMLGYGLWRGTAGQPSAQEVGAMRWLFALAIVPGALAMLTLVRVREIRPGERPPVNDRAKEGRFAGWRVLPRRFYAFVGIVTLFALGNSSDLFLLFYARTLFDWGLAQLFGAWVALHVGKVVFSFPGGILSDRLGRRPLILAGWLVYALVYLAMARLTAEWHFWALLVAYALYYGLTEGAEKALVTDLVPAELRGTAFGVYHGAIGLAALPASLVFGVFWGVLGPRVAFGIGAALAGTAAVLLTVFLSTARRPAG